MKISDIYKLLDTLAPFSLQLDYDNSGMLIGSLQQDADTVLFALDVTDRVIDEAIACGAELIISHHPLMFSSRKQITDSDYEGRLILRLIRNNIALISAHTNLDSAPNGTNDTLAKVCGLTSVTGTGFGRIGYLPKPIPARVLKSDLKVRLATEVRIMGDPEKLISSLAVCSGSGSEEWKKYLSYDIDGFLSGEIRHHHALAMTGAGIVAFECGHFATEQPGIFAFADALQTAVNQIKCNLRIFKSASGAYPMLRNP